MWTCPVCEQKNAVGICSNCGFDHSADREQFPTLERTGSQTAASSLREAYADRIKVSSCPCCGGLVSGTNCSYCGFDAVRPPAGQSPEAVRRQAEDYADTIVAALTDFSIVAYRYAWAPQRSRLELQEEEILSLGDARTFYGNIVWADKEFGQLRNGRGTELSFDITYHYKNQKKVLTCRIPTIKCDKFWRLGISLDRSLHLKIYLGAGKNFIESAPVELDLT